MQAAFATIFRTTGGFRPFLGDFLNAAKSFMKRVTGKDFHNYMIT
jgi:hypothetical protein